MKPVFSPHLAHSSIALTILLLASCNGNADASHDSSDSTLTSSADSSHQTKLPVDTLTFDVADVELAKDPLIVSDAKKVFENKLEKEITYMPANHQGQQFAMGYGNVFLRTIHTCFDQHRPLRLSPDMIWLTICQGIAIHINEKFDSLQPIIFKENRPKELVVRNDSLINGDPNEWAKLISGLSNETSKHVNADYYAFFVPEFSTTSPEIKTAYEITLMHSFKKAFDYIGESGCGIPSIELVGNKQDWIWIQTNLAMLTDLGLDYWRQELEPIIAEFVSVYDGETNTAFWNDLYKHMSDYNAEYISGWIIKFFPYLEDRKSTGSWDDETGMWQAETVYIPNPFLKGDAYFMSTLSIGDFPSGILDATIVWNNYYDNTTQNMIVHAGFFGIKQDADLTLEPVVSWAICKEDADRAYHKLGWDSPEPIKHPGESWSPIIQKKLKQKPVFMPEKFETSDESYAHLKSILKDSATTKYDTTLLDGKTISFVVLSNGHVEQITFNGDKAVGTYLETVLKSYNGNWSAAQAKVSDVYRMWEEFFDDGNKLLKVNAMVSFTF